MKTRLLRILRQDTLSKYDVRKPDAVNCGENPWRIWTGPKTYLAYHEYSSRAAAVDAVKRMWHEEAEKYLWNHRDLRKNKIKIW